MITLHFTVNWGSLWKENPLTSSLKFKIRIKRRIWTCELAWLWVPAWVCCAWWRYVAWLVDSCSSEERIRRRGSYACHMFSHSRSNRFRCTIGINSCSWRRSLRRKDRQLGRGRWVAHPPPNPAWSGTKICSTRSSTRQTSRPWLIRITKNWSNYNFINDR